MKSSPQAFSGRLVGVLAGAAILLFPPAPASARVLEFVQARQHLDLEGARTIAVSPDGGHLYVGGSVVNVFARNAATGALAFVEREEISAADVTLSPDGRYVYVAGQEMVAVLERDDTLGTLELVDSWNDPDAFFLSVTVSPDGKNVYATSSSDALTVLQRDTGSGALSFLEAHLDGADGVDGLAGARSVTVSPDGRSLYVASPSDSAVAVFARQASTGSLSFVEALFDGTDGVDGLAGARSVTVSPDGRNLYVAGSSDSAVAVFARQAGTGTLSFVEAFFDDAGGVDGLAGAVAVALSPDGRDLYVAGGSDSAVAVFARQSGTGRLSFVGAHRDELRSPGSVTVSPDGHHLYLSEAQYPPAVKVLARQEGTGMLSFVESHFGGNFGIAGDGLAGAFTLAVSPDGRNLYVVSIDDGALVVLARQAGTGMLSFVEAHGLGGFGGNSVVVSPDGRHVYIAQPGASQLRVFARQADTGTLGLVETLGTGDGLGRPWSVAISPDGQHVYVTQEPPLIPPVDEAVLVFARQASTGTLSFVQAIPNGVGGLDGLGRAGCLTVSPDGQNLYAASSEDGAVAVFARQASTGTLSFVEAFSDLGLGDGPNSVAISPDGRSLYAAGGDAVAALAREAGTGRLSFLEAHRGELDGLGGANSVTVDPDGRYVYASPWVDDAVAVFTRDAGSGALNLVEVHLDGAAEVRGLDGARSVTASPDGRNVYLVGHYDDAVTVFRKQNGECRPGAAALCLNRSRFRAELEWHDFEGDTGTARAVPYGSDDSGLLWFFAAENWEMLVKVLDACSFNDRFWVFAAATTNVGYALRVTDELTGVTKTYRNPLGQSAAAITDTDAFATCSATAAASGTVTAGAGASFGSPLSPGTSGERHSRADLTPPDETVDEDFCRPGPRKLCLNQSRFQVEVEWRDFQGNTGTGRRVAYGTGDSGLLWFFGSKNWEMLVKVLDACGLNDRYWVFAAATTDVEYTLRVTDTESGLVREYHNPLGNAAPALTDTDAFATCFLRRP